MHYLQVKEPSTSDGSTNGNNGGDGKAKNTPEKRWDPSSPHVANSVPAKIVSSDDNSKRRIGKVLGFVTFFTPCYTLNF